MSPGHVIQSFIKDFVQDLHNDSVAIFAGAGLSKGSGYVDWPELLRDIAKELGLDVDKEHDFISLAQFHVNTRRGSDGLAKKILQEFSEQAEPCEVHDIIARLPIRSFWTTNYDSLIEAALQRAYRVPDVKCVVDHLIMSKPKRDAIVYKMHGDVQLPQQAIIYKEQYEKYHITHAPFVTALSGDLVSKTFLFIGFSFTDPNLDYVLSRLHGGSNKRNHYCFMREAQRTTDDDELFQYKRRKQELRIEDLKRFGIQALLVDNYSDITDILSQIEARYRKRTVFFSGSAEEYGTWSRRDAMDFVHDVAAKCIEANCRVVNGFGWGIGSAVINGALEAIYGNPQKYSEAQLIVRPFPQHGENLPALWEQYRQRMISLAGVALFFFGNKVRDGGGLVNAGGVRREFEIALQHGLLPIPVAATGFMAEELWKEISTDMEKYYGDFKWVGPMVEKLADPKTTAKEMAKTITDIIKQLNK